MATRRTVGVRLARLLPVPAALASGVLVVLAPAGWPRIAAAVAIGALVAVFTPYWLEYAAGARRPTEAERRAAASGLEISTAVRLRVAPESSWVGNAIAAGVLPGKRYVFVAADLFEVLDEEAIGAVVAHEIAHHARRHVLLRHGIAVAAAGYVVALAEFAPWRLLPTVAVGALPYLLGTAWIVRRTEWEADRAAARSVDPAALADALETLVSEELVLGGASRLRRLFTEHPPIQSRIARLRELAER